MLNISCGGVNYYSLAAGVFLSLKIVCILFCLCVFFSTSKPDNLSANYVRSFKVFQMTLIRPLSASKKRRNSACLILQVIGNVVSFECLLLGILKARVIQK